MPFFGEQDTKVPDPQTDQEAAAIAQQQGIPLPEITVSGPLTQLWEELVQVGKDGMTEEEIIEVAAHASAEMSYTVEAGSGRRRNQAKLAEDFNQLSSMLLQPFIQMAMAGNVDPYNWLIGLAGDIFDRSVDGAMLKKGEQQEQPDPAAEAQAEAQQMQMQMQMQLEQQKSQQELQGQQQQQEMDASSQQTQMQQQAMQAEMQAAQQAQQIAMQQQAHEQKTRHAEEAHRHGMKMREQQAKQKPKSKGK
jgi:flagellar biosynthesis GTPase FlhF